MSTVLGDPEDAPLPELTYEDIEGLTGIPQWTSDLLDQLDVTPAQWIDIPDDAVVGNASSTPINPPPTAPDGSAAADEYNVGYPCANCCKECVGKLTAVTTSAHVNALTIGRHCKLGALSAKRIDSRFQTIEAQTGAIGEIKDELVRYGLAIEAIQQQILVVEAAARVNTRAMDRGVLISNMARKIWLIENTAQDNIRAYKAMSDRMTIMNDALDMLTMKR